MLRKILSAALVLCLLTGCAGPAAERSPKIYEATFLNLFDTVTTIKGSAESEAEFAETAQRIHDDLLYYHQLFDVYKEYEGVNNLKTVNDRAGVAPVEVDRAVIDLLTDCRSFYELTGGKVNVAMGSVLHLWHVARNDGLDDPTRAALPDMDALKAASEHTDLDAVVMDEAASTVYLSDPEMRLDVGAIAKGWAAQKVAENAPAGLLISVGGNVCATGPKTADTPWVIGVRDPAGSASDYLHTLYVSGGSVVTSGDYQRCYMVDGKFYHHIIDPATLYPSTYWRSVTILCADSGLADALSTALFLLPYEAGLALAEKCGAEAFWINEAGEQFYTPGFEAYIRT
jgi:thiamine biosynthesis lipoprotein